MLSDIGIDDFEDMSVCTHQDEDGERFAPLRVLPPAAI